MTVLQLKKKIHAELDNIEDKNILSHVLEILEKEEHKSTLHWSDFAGTIPFKGDSLAFQQKLRAEWND